MKIHGSHNTRTDDDEKSYCILCGNAGKSLVEECPDIDQLDIYTTRNDGHNGVDPW